MILALLLLLQMRVPDAAQFVGEPKGRPIAGAELAQRTNEVAALLRCPVCQGMSVADSKAEMAVNMKGQVRDLLERGYTEDQILLYFEKSYGQFVLLEPKKEGVNWLVWLLPVAILAIGAAVVWTTLQKLQRPATPRTLASQQPSHPATQQPAATEQLSNPATPQPRTPATQQPSNPATAGGTPAPAPAPPEDPYLSRVRDLVAKGKS